MDNDIPVNEFRRIVHESNSFWLNTLDNEAKVTFWNKAAENISGYTQKEVLGRNDIWELLYPDEKYRNTVLEKAFEIINEGKQLQDFETTISTKEGIKKRLSWNTHNIKDSQNNVIGSMAIAIDVTKLKTNQEELELIANELEQSNQKLRELSYVDKLTNIANRRAYEEKVVSLIDTSKRTVKELSFFMIDIDYFKQYNDTYGHAKGDTVLFRVCNILKDTLERSTDFIARYGGEEIVVILPFTPIKESESIASKIGKSDEK